MLVTAGYELHQNFKPGQPVNGNYSGTDTGTSWAPGMRSDRRESASFTPNRNWIRAQGTDANVSAWGIGSNGPWWSARPPRRLSPCEQVPTGNFVAGPGATLLPQSDNRVFNGGRGDTGGSLWQISCCYPASKRTELTAGYVAVRNDANARYSCLDIRPRRPRENQSAFAMSIKNTF